MDAVTRGLAVACHLGAHRAGPLGSCPHAQWCSHTPQSLAWADSPSSEEGTTPRRVRAPSPHQSAHPPPAGLGSFQRQLLLPPRRGGAGFRLVHRAGTAPRPPCSSLLPYSCCGQLCPLQQLQTPSSLEGPDRWTLLVSRLVLVRWTSPCTDSAELS